MSTIEKRRYSRINVSAEGSFILSDRNVAKREFIGKIRDISEGGLKVLISTDDFEHVSKFVTENYLLSFQGFEKYVLSGVVQSAVFTGQLFVTRVEKDNNNILLGCKFKELTPELSEYVYERKLAV